MEGALTQRASRPADDDDETANESSPLLAAGTSSSRDRPSSIAPSVAPNHPKFLRVVIMCVLLAFLLDFGDSLQRAPMMRIFEDAICRKYYEALGSTIKPRIDLSLPIPEDDCKIPPVQGELAMLKALDMTFASLPSLVVAVPYGYVADTYGRKLVLILVVSGLTLGFGWSLVVAYFSAVIDVRWLWAGNAFFLIGGGASVLRAMLYSMLADVASEDRRASAFFQIMAASLISNVVGVPIAWYTMKTQPWIPTIAGLVTYIVAILSCFFLPETLERPEPSVLVNESTTEEEFEPVERPASLHQYSKKKNLVKILEKIEAYHFIFKSPELTALSITFLLQTLGSHVTTFTLQLASERFHWSLGDASFLTPVSAGTNFIVLIVILPAVYYVLSHKLHLPSMIKDLIVARGSLAFLIIGALGIAWGPIPGLFILAVMIFALGSGFSSALRSLVTSLVHPDEVSRLYALIAVVDTIGTLLYGPVLSRAFGWGLDLGGPWTGMFFIVVAAIYIVIGLPVWLVRTPKPEMDVHG